MAEETPLIAQEIEETLVTTEERAARQQSCQDAVPESLPAEKAEDIPPEPEETLSEKPAELPEPKRKPGRPAGSKNKQPAKPRAKRVVVSEAVEYAPPPSPAPAALRAAAEPSPAPRWDAQHQPIPTEAKTEMAELMLRLLSGQAMERQRRKDAQRRAWFS